MKRTACLFVLFLSSSTSFASVNLVRPEGQVTYHKVENHIELRAVGDGKTLPVVLSVRAFRRLLGSRVEGRVIDRLIADMNDGNTHALATGPVGVILGNLADTLLTAVPCSPATVDAAPAGFICRTKNALWRVEEERYLLESHFAGGNCLSPSAKAMGLKCPRVYQDLSAGLKITEPHHVEREGCANTYYLPSGYPAPQASDFALLEKDGFREVLPNLARRPLQSSSNRDQEDAYFFDSSVGQISFAGIGFPDTRICISEHYE